jgi:hypothetical protein
MLNKSAATLLLLVAFAMPVTAVAQSDQPTTTPQPASTPAAPPPPASMSEPPPDSALGARFNSFFGQVIAGHVPRGNVSPQVQTSLTAQLLARIDSAFAGFGPFRRLQYVSHDNMEGYERYHFLAVFEKGSQGFMFIVDSNGTIAGFFEDQNSASGSQ